jgi:hypothetical protein
MNYMYCLCMNYRTNIQGRMPHWHSLCGTIAHIRQSSLDKSLALDRYSIVTSKFDLPIREMTSPVPTLLLLWLWCAILACIGTLLKLNLIHINKHKRSPIAGWVLLIVDHAKSLASDNSVEWEAGGPLAPNTYVFFQLSSCVRLSSH